MSDNLKRKSIDKPCEYCGVKVHCIPSRPDKKYCSLKCRGLSQTGSNNPAWDGGKCNGVKRETPEYKKWRFNVFKRDNFTCQKCGYRGGELTAHHILSYARFENTRTIVHNGETLCRDCHGDFHHLYGTKKFTDKDYWEWL